MSSRKTPIVAFLSLFLTIFAAQITARAVGDDEDEYDVSARVVRISLLHGDVSLKRHGSDDWETARLNMPLVEGDTLATGSEARAEIQIDARNFVRVASNSAIKIVTLRNDGIALSLAEGTATLRLARFDHEREFFEIDAPKTTIAAEKEGLYRIDVARNGSIHVAVHDGGRARLYSETAGFTIKDGRAAALTLEGDDAGDWQLVSASAKDSWDDWVVEREKYLATRLKYEQNARYYDSDIWGAEDLDAYGSWAYVNDYGWIWRPNVTIINNYNDWAPYRLGSWFWCEPYGWTWVGDEPWGWAPYHYGRWVYYNNYWAWCPHSYYPHRRSWWRPALVAFISLDFNYGSHYCWYPLSYHQHDPRSNYFRSRDRLTPLSSRELADLRRANPAYLRAVTAVPARDFGNRAARPQPANGDLARRAIGAEPLRGDLHVRPAVGAGNTTGAGRASVARTPAIPAAAQAGRPTGAAIRTPGVPLDNDLRRQRIFNGRDPVSVSTPPTSNGMRSSEPRPTGAVARPPRPVGQPIDRSDDPNRVVDGSGTPVDRSARPARPREERPSSPDANKNSERRNPSPDWRPSTPPPRENRPAPPTDRPPERSDRNPPAQPPSRPPSNSDSGSKPTRPDRTEQPEPRRSEPPPQRSEPPARSEPPQRSSPPPRSDPPPRSEPPPRSDPPARSEPAPRSDPPARSEPAPRSESPRSDAPARPEKPPTDS